MIKKNICYLVVVFSIFEQRMQCYSKNILKFTKLWRGQGPRFLNNTQYCYSSQNKVPDTVFYQDLFGKTLQNQDKKGFQKAVDEYIKTIRPLNASEYYNIINQIEGALKETRYGQELGMDLRNDYLKEFYEDGKTGDWYEKYHNIEVPDNRRSNLPVKGDSLEETSKLIDKPFYKTELNEFNRPLQKEIESPVQEAWKMVDNTLENKENKKMIEGQFKAVKSIDDLKNVIRKNKELIKTIDTYKFDFGNIKFDDNLRNLLQDSSYYFRINNWKMYPDGNDPDRDFLRSDIILFALDMYKLNNKYKKQTEVSEGMVNDIKAVLNNYKDFIKGYSNILLPPEFKWIMQDFAPDLYALEVQELFQELLNEANDDGVSMSTKKATDFIQTIKDKENKKMIEGQFKAVKSIDDLKNVIRKNKELIKTIDTYKFDFGNIKFDDNLRNLLQDSNHDFKITNWKMYPNGDDPKRHFVKPDIILFALDLYELNNKYKKQTEVSEGMVNDIKAVLNNYIDFIKEVAELQNYYSITTHFTGIMSNFAPDIHTVIEKLLKEYPK